MSNYEDDRYLDGEEKRPSLLPLLLFIILIVVILVIVISCSMKKTNVKTNTTKVGNQLSYINVGGAKIEPEFKSDVYNYDVTTDKNSLFITCGLENSSAVLEGCNEEVVLTKDVETYVIKVTSGISTKSYTLNIKKNNTSNTTVTVTSEKTSNNDEYKLKAVVSPSADNLVYYWYKDESIIPNSNTNEITVNKSGSYYVNVKQFDSLLTPLNIYSNVVTITVEDINNKNTNNNNNNNNNNVNNNNNSNNNNNNKNTNNNSNNTTNKENQNNTSSYTLEISEVKGNSSTWVKSISLTVNAKASNGLATDAYSFDGGKTYQKSNTKTFTSNQTVKIVVKDSKGNTTSKTIELKKIDTTVPKVTISSSNETSISILLSADVTPAKTSSGYKYQWYRNGSVIKNATSYLYKATESGKYKVVVTTGSGNKVTSSDYSYVLSAERCPTLTAITKDNKYVAPRSWIGEPVYIKVNMPKSAYKYSVYVNDSGNYKSVNTNLTYYQTFTNDVAIKLSNGGMRYIKIISYDASGIKTNCYSDIYYIR